MFMGATTAAAGLEGKKLYPPTFRPSPGWVTVSTGAQTASGPPPVSWAVPTHSNQAGTGPYGFTDGLERLRGDGVVIVAATVGRGGAEQGWARSRWPLRLSSFRIDRGWEGQPAANIQQRLRWVAVTGWHLDVRVYFGTQHPSTSLLASVQAELDRLTISPS